MNCFASLLATTWVWLSPANYVEQSDIIAILHVGTVHEERTPEAIVVRSASATLENLVYYRFLTPGPPRQSIFIYQIDPNGHLEGGSAFGQPKLTEGRSFAMLKQQGEGRFIPYDRFSLQVIKDGKIYWPTVKLLSSEVPLDQVLGDLRELLPKP